MFDHDRGDPVIVMSVGLTAADMAILANALSHLGAALSECRSGRDAVSRCVEVSPAVIVGAAANGSEIDGFEVVRSMARYESTREIPILVVSTGIEADMGRLAEFESATIDILASPINPAALAAKLKVLLELVRTRGMLRDMIRLGAAARQEAKGAALALNSAGLRDPVSGLATRELLFDRVRFAVARCLRRGDHLACLHIKFDNFNQYLGASDSDLEISCLRHVGRCIADSVRRSDTCARLGEGDFLVVAEAAPEEEVLRIGELLCEQLSEPFSPDGRDLEVCLSVSIGISQLSMLEVVSGGAEAELLMTDLLLERAADANARASQLGPGRCVLAS